MLSTSTLQQIDDLPLQPVCGEFLLDHPLVGLCQFAPATASETLGKAVQIEHSIGVAIFLKTQHEHPVVAPVGKVIHVAARCRCKMFRFARAMISPRGYSTTSSPQRRSHRLAAEKTPQKTRLRLYERGQIVISRLHYTLCYGPTPLVALHWWPPIGGPEEKRA